MLLRLSALALVLASTAQAASVQVPMKMECGPQAVVKAALVEKGFSIRSAGVSHNGMPHGLWVNQDDTEWLMAIQVQNQMCVYAAGQSWASTEAVDVSPNAKQES